MRLRFHAALLAACLTAAAQGRGSVRDLVAQVRAALQRNRSDGRIAKDLRNVQLSERLDDRTIETLQSEGAGAETVAQLVLLRDRSSRMHVPAAPAIPEPPAPSTAEQVQIWNAARDNASNYTHSLPDFICNEVVRRYTSSNGKGAWKLDDTLALKLTFFEQREDYQLMTVNKRPTSLSYEQMRGAITEGEFGSMLAAIFTLESRTNRKWDHWTLLRSRPTHVYTFAIAAANSDFRIKSGMSRRDEEQATVGQHGYVYIDASTKMVVRLAAIADEFPVGFPVERVNIILDYDFLDVGGTHFWLPLHSETTLITPPLQHRNETDFLAYRKFSADANITYEGVKK